MKVIKSEGTTDPIMINYSIMHQATQTRPDKEIKPYDNNVVYQTLADS